MEMKDREEFDGRIDQSCRKLQFALHTRSIEQDGPHMPARSAYKNHPYLTAKGVERNVAWIGNDTWGFTFAQMFLFGFVKQCPCPLSYPHEMLFQNATEAKAFVDDMTRRNCRFDTYNFVVVFLNPLWFGPDQLSVSASAGPSKLKDLESCLDFWQVRCLFLKYSLETAVENRVNSKPIDNYS